MSELTDLQRAILAWGVPTFPAATVASACRHLREEIDEIEAAYGAGEPDERFMEECADALIILLHIAGRWGNGDLLAAALAKFAIVQQRQWLPPDENGVVRHVAGSGVE